MQKTKRKNGFLSIIVWNGVLTIVLVSLMFLFHYFSFMDVHLLSIVKTIFTKKASTVEMFFFLYCLIVIIATLAILPYYVFFPKRYPLLGEFVFALFLTIFYLYIIPLLFISVQIASYNLQTIIHFFCMFFIYSIAIGETIRLKYMI